MSENRKYNLFDDEKLNNCLAYIKESYTRLQDMPETLHIEISLYHTNRTLEQNDKMWAMLSDVSTQVEWYGRYLSADDWKDLFTAILKKSHTIPGIEGGFVCAGLASSRLSTKEMGDLIEIIYAFGAEHEVDWRDADDVPSAL